MEVDNFPDYLIYNNGKVFSKKSKRFLKDVIKKNGYKQISLFRNGQKKSFLVHRLVGIYYLSNPENKPTIDHINRNKSDNRIENLRWATKYEQEENKGNQNNNTSGHKGISYCKTYKKWKYQKRGKYKIQRSFKSKIDTLCFKYIYLLKIKSHLV